MRPRARCFLGPGERRGPPSPFSVSPRPAVTQHLQSAPSQWISAFVTLHFVGGSAPPPVFSLVSQSASTLHSRHSFIHSSLPVPSANASCPSAPFSANVPSHACQWSASFPALRTGLSLSGASLSTSQLSPSSLSRPLPSVDACKGVTELGCRVGGVVSAPSHLDTFLLIGLPLVTFPPVPPRCHPSPLQCPLPSPDFVFVTYFHLTLLPVVPQLSSVTHCRSVTFPGASPPPPITSSFFHTLL